MRKKLILIAACLSVFFEALDVSIVALAIPSIKIGLNATAEKTEWLQTIYMLLYAGFLILGGRLADIFGRKTIYLIGSCLFLASSFAAGFAGNIEQLLVCRGVQGIGAAFAIPAAIAIITNLYSTETEVNNALGVFGSFAALGFASGLMSGGLVVNILSWKWIFWINVPVILLIILIAIWLLPNSNMRKEQKNTDVLGGALLTTAIIVLTYSIHLVSLPNQKMNALSAFLIFIVLIFLFFKQEKKHSHPLIDVKIFRDRYLRQMNFAGLMLGASFISYVSFLSIFLQEILQYTPAYSGLLLFPFSICSALVAKYFLPFIQRKTSVKSTAILGHIFLGVGCLSLILASIFTNFFLVIISVFCVNAVAISIIYPSLTSLSVQSSGKQDHGVIAGIQSTAYSAGCGIGIALIWSVVRLLIHDEKNATQNTVITAMIIIFAFCSIAVWNLKKTHENTYSG
jgi:MFS family permease